MSLSWKQKLKLELTDVPETLQRLLISVSGHLLYLLSLDCVFTFHIIELDLPLIIVCVCIFSILSSFQAPWPLFTNTLYFINVQDSKNMMLLLENVL